MSHAESRSELLDQVERLLRFSNTPLSKAEIARRCGVERSTIGRLEESLLARGVPLRYTDENHWYIDRQAYITHVKLTQHEALGVYLACRLLARYSDKPNAHVVGALEKVAVALEAITRPLGKHIHATTQVLREQLPASPSSHQQHLEILGQAWMEGNTVDIQYRPLRAKLAFRERFDPYLLEPSALGFGTYAIGYSHLQNRMRIRKLERIESILPTTASFSIPETFDAVTLLKNAWGIWFDEEDKPTPVTLRFSSLVHRRVLESRWHPSQATEAEPDGSLLWRAELDALEEFIPWVRSWGPDCQALEPATLREQIAGESYQQARLYGWSVSKGSMAGKDDHSAFSDMFGGK